MQGLGPYAVFVDANVWFSRTIRDWLGVLYVTPEAPPFVVHWTEDVLAELFHHLRKRHPEWSGARMVALRAQIAGTFEAGRVEDFLIDETYRGPDLGDAHVHAAAVACRADVLLTCDSSGFAWDENSSPYEVMTPDEFLLLVDDVNPGLVVAAALRMCDHWVARTGEADLAGHLRTAGCPQFAARVEAHLQLLAR